MTEQKAEQFRTTYQAIQSEISKRIVGQQEVVDAVIDALFLGGHVLLEGVPGLGKTLLVRTLADALELRFSRIQFTPDLMPADILGTNIIIETNPGQKQFLFQRGPVFAHILLADEINRATPKTQSALLEAMQERGVTVGGVRNELEEPFYVLATQNPIEMEGTYPLPEAQLDRFLYKVLVQFPKESDLLAILNRTTVEDTAQIKPAANRERVREFAHLILQVPAAETVVQYAAQLVLRTHPDHPDAPAPIKQYVRFGSSPRGAQALILSAKIRALKEGRYNASRDDVASAALQSLRHRLILNLEGLAENISPDSLIQQLIQS
jgi:MoxR-like ATPase